MKYFGSHLLYERNCAFRALTAIPELKFQSSYPMGKIIQNVNFSLVSQNSDSSSKLNFNRQHESKDILSFQNRALDISHKSR